MDQNNTKINKAQPLVTTVKRFAGNDCPCVVAMWLLVFVCRCHAGMCVYVGEGRRLVYGYGRANRWNCSVKLNWGRR